MKRLPYIFLGIGVLFLLNTIVCGTRSFGGGLRTYYEMIFVSSLIILVCVLEILWSRYLKNDSQSKTKNERFQRNDKEHEAKYKEGIRAQHSLDAVKHIRDLWQKGRINDALSYLVTKIPNDCYTEELLVYKACLIQISDCDGYDLEDAEKILKLVCEFYPNSADAHYELGKFYDAVMGDCHKGLEYLSTAKSILLKKLDEVEQGIRECEVIQD